MKSQWCRRASVASVASIAALLMASPASAALDKCESSIGKEVSKLEGKILGALQKCVDTYRKSAEAGQAGGDLADEAGKCETQLQKAIAFTGGSGTSAIDKAYAKLSTLVSGAKCTNPELQLLGHVREDVGNPSSTWARITLLKAYKSAMDSQIGSVSSTLGAFIDLYDSDTGTSCPTCAKLRKGGPCATHSCKVGGASGACVENNGADIPVALAGSQLLVICKDSTILSGNLAVFGTLSKGLDPVNLGGGTFACVSADTSEGTISATGSTQPTVDYKICMDHMVESPETDECPGSQPVGYGAYACGPARADIETGSPPTHSGTNGGGCLSTKLGPPVYGEGFLMNTTQINVVFSAEHGPDALPCTMDDTGKAAQPGTFPLTTGQGDAEVLDSDMMDGVTLPNNTSPACPVPAVSTGAAFDPVEVESSNLGGGTFAGSFSAVHSLFGPPRIDTVTSFKLECQ